MQNVIRRKRCSGHVKKFHRVNSHDAKDAYGYGLGLYMVRLLVEAQGGEIWVEGTVGEGSRFSFSIPLARETEGDADEGATY